MLLFLYRLAGHKLAAGITMGPHQSDKFFFIYVRLTAALQPRLYFTT